VSNPAAAHGSPPTHEGSAPLEFRFTATIARPCQEVFAFLRDIDQHAGQEGTLVPVYDKITPGPVGVGTHYREIVQLLPFLRGEVITEVTEFEEADYLGYRFVAMGMEGRLAYRLEAVPEGTYVVQDQSFTPRGFLRLFRVPIRRMFSTMAGQRLKEIKALLEQASLEQASPAQ